MTHTDDWIWFDAPELNEVDLSEQDVTAVLVCRNAGAWLNATLAGLGQLDRRPNLVIAVDNASSDDTPELLTLARQAGLVDRIVAGKPNASFGQAVERALATVETPTQWIWLLHDDGVPDATALTELLTLAARTPRLAIALPLLVRPARRHHAARTLEIGATISGSGRRALGLEPDEVAQGQYESTSVLGGSTCGMLIRWRTLTEIGGFDRCISAYRDGIDLGWRAHLLGQWVLTCPRARFVHRQAGRSEIRRDTIASQSGRSEAEWDRLMGLRLVSAHTHGLQVLPNLIYLTVVCLLSALAYLGGRAPDRAREELQAWVDFLFRSRRPVVRLRKTIKTIAQGNTSKMRVRSLRPTVGSVVEDAFQGAARWLQAQLSVRRDADMTLDDLLGDEFTRRLGEGRRRIPVAIWVVAVVAGVALMARGLYRTGLVTASGLLGAPESLNAAVERALSAAGRSEPWLTISAAGSAVTWHPQWFPVVVLVLAVPVTTLVAAWYLKQHLEHGGIRWLAALGYALLPVLMGGLNRGALWLVLIAVLVPFLAEWVTRLGRPWTGARSLQALAGVVFTGILVVGIYPVLWLPAMAVVMVVAASRGRTIRVVVAAAALLAPLAFWAPSWPGLVRHPWRLLLTPEPLLTPPGLGWQMLFARPVGAGLPPLWLSIGTVGALWLVVVVVVFNRTWHRWPILFGVGSIAVGMWLSVLRLPTDLGSTHPDPSPWLLIGFALLLYAAAAWIDATLGTLEGRDFGGRQALVGTLSLVLIAAFLLTAGWGAYAGMSQVSRGPDSRLPQYLIQNETLFDAATLIIDGPSGTWNLRYGGQTLWGQASFRDGPTASGEALAELEQVVARALDGRPDDSVTAQLARFGVSTVVVLDPSPATVAGLDATTGFQRPGEIGLWVIAIDGQSPTRRAVVTSEGVAKYLQAADPVPAGSPGTLVLATPPDPALHVFVGGTELRPADSGDWRAGYALAGASGPITFERTTANQWMAWTQLGLMILVVIFVLPPIGDRTSVYSRPRYQMIRSAKK